MIPLAFGRHNKALKLLCIGAHSDDIEIGVGGTISALISAGYELDVVWCVASAVGSRQEEAELSAAAFLRGTRSSRIVTGSFRDGYFPYVGGDLKGWVEDLKGIAPDLVFTHRRDDAHQDHRELCKLTWNAFRDHLVLEYEIPKWDGDLGRPNFYVPLSKEDLDRKISLLEQHFATQRSKDWFDAETFRGLARLRGMECRAADGYAEAFVARKLILGGSS